MSSILRRRSSGGARGDTISTSRSDGSLEKQTRPPFFFCVACCSRLPSPSPGAEDGKAAATAAAEDDEDEDEDDEDDNGEPSPVLSSGTSGCLDSRGTMKYRVPWAPGDRCSMRTVVTTARRLASATPVGARTNSRDLALPKAPGAAAGSTPCTSAVSNRRLPPLLPPPFVPPVPSLSPPPPPPLAGATARVESTDRYLPEGTWRRRSGCFQETSTLVNGSMASKHQQALALWFTGLEVSSPSSFFK